MSKMKAHKRWDKGLVNLYEPVEGRKAQVAAFMSGSGTNVQRVLEYEEMLGDKSPFHVSVIVTDRPKTSNARKIWSEWTEKWGAGSIQFVAHDIKKFYAKRGERKVSIRTQKGQEIREQYTKTLSAMLEDCTIDFAVFGGFVPLTNITDDFPCLNVHPGDLSHIVDGKKTLGGLHEVPIQAALDEGLDYVRSSVILAVRYTGVGEDMDTGPLIALGPKMLIGDVKDAGTIQDKLKEASDWKVLPIAVEEVARGNVVVDFSTNRVYHSKSGGTGIVIPQTTHIKDYLE